MMVDGFWKGPFSLKSANVVEGLQLMMERHRLMQRWEVPVPKVQLFSTVGDRGQMWIKYEQLSPIDPVKWQPITHVLITHKRDAEDEEGDDDKKDESKKKKTKKNAEAIVNREARVVTCIDPKSAGVIPMNSKDAKAAFWKEESVVCDAIRALTARALTEPRCGESYLANLVLVGGKRRVFSINLDRVSHGALVVDEKKSTREKSPLPGWIQLLCSVHAPSSKVIRAMEEGVQLHSAAVLASVEKLLETAKGDLETDEQRQRATLIEAELRKVCVAKDAAASDSGAGSAAP